MADIDVDAELDRAGLHNPHVREFVRYWAALTEPDAIEVVSADDDARLIEESLAAGEIRPSARAGTTRAATRRTPHARKSAPSSPRPIRPTPASTTTGARRLR